MLKVLAHMLGDGHISGAFGTKLAKGKSHSEYRNFSNDLLDSFVQDIQVFGQIKLSIDYKHGHVIVPNSIGYILTHIYGIKFDTFSSRIPESLFTLDKKEISGFIKAFFDDEGHVYDSSIEVYSGNKNIIKGLKALIRSKFPTFKISKIKTNLKTRGKQKYSFSILSESLSDYQNQINFDCVKKRKSLEFAIKRRRNWDEKRKTKDTPHLILNILNNKGSTAKDMSREIFVRHSHILDILNKLEKENHVIRTRKTYNGAWIWTLKWNSPKYQRQSKEIASFTILSQQK